MAQFNVTSAPYNATGNGITDDRTAIQSAIDACKAAGGGVVYFPKGTYRVTNSLTMNNTITVDYSNIGLVGEGNGTQILCDFSGSNVANNVFNIGSSSTSDKKFLNCFFRDFTIVSKQNNKATGAGFFCKYTDGLEFRNIRICPFFIDSPNNELLPYGFYFQYFGNVLLNRIFVHASITGVTAYGQTDQNWGYNLFIDGGSKITTESPTQSGLSLPNSIGIHIGGSVGGFSIEDTDVINCETGILLNSTLSGNYNREIFINQCFVDSSAHTGVKIDGATLVHINNAWVASAGTGYPNNPGINIDITTNNPANLRCLIDGARIFNAMSHGINVLMGDVSITSSMIHDNGKGTNGGNGINASNSSGMLQTLLVNANYIGSNVTNGLYLDSTVDRYYILGNIFRTNSCSTNSNVNKKVDNLILP